MKKLNKKGFTIVELVIVIAVIAILAGVMIPTFSGIVKKANESAALQEAEATFKADLVLVNAQPTADNQYKKTTDTTPADDKTYYTYADSVYTASESLESFVDGTTYYEKVCVGTFTVAANGTYTYTVEVEGYTAAFDGNEWKLTEK